MVIKKAFPGHGVFMGRISLIDKSIPAEWEYHITYEDGDKETMLLAEVTPLLEVAGDKLRQYAVEELRGAYEYLEKRLTGNCDSSYDCSKAYSWCVS